jgi:FAD/FMN-containing dehydrogenase
MNFPVPPGLNLPDILDVKSVEQWSNYSGTIMSGIIPLFCTPRPATKVLGRDPGALKSQADAVNALLKFCFANPAPLRTMGSRWSFSSIIQPKNMILDTPNLNSMARLGPSSQSDGYKASRGAQGFVPYWIMGGTEISAINRRLFTDFPDKPLCLRTSGAADGQRIAGAIATGTHGAAIDVGALHDTVLAVHLLVAPDEAVLIQSGSSPALNDSFVGWLQNETGIPTTQYKDDDLLAAALVSLGSLGIVFSLVVETEPAYRLLRHIKWFNDRNDASLWTAIKTLNTSAFYPGEEARPFHFEVLFNPYPCQGDPASMLTLMWKKPAGNIHASSADLVPPAMPSDTMSFIARLVGGLDGKLTGKLVAHELGGIINSQVKTMFGAADGTLLFPGQVFGPTDLPKGTGASTEIVIDYVDTERTVRAMWDVFAEQSKLGKHLLGAMSLRFVPASKAHMAMNINAMNCFIEMPSIKNQGVLDVYTAVWNRLEKDGIPFTCHWGQLSGMNAGRLSKYYKGREVKWKAAREKLLDATGRKVFSAPLLAQVGLD